MNIICYETNQSNGLILTYMYIKDNKINSKNCVINLIPSLISKMCVRNNIKQIFIQSFTIRSYIKLTIEI